MSMKKQIPINQRIASKLASEHLSLHGVIEEKSTTTVFYNENKEPVLKMVKTFPVEGQEMISYFGYFEELKGDDHKDNIST